MTIIQCCLIDECFLFELRLVCTFFGQFYFFELMNGDFQIGNVGFGFGYCSTVVLKVPGSKRYSIV